MLSDPLEACTLPVLGSKVRHKLECSVSMVSRPLESYRVHLSDLLIEFYPKQSPLWCFAAT